MPQLRLRMLGVVERRADAFPLLRESGDAVVVARGHDRLFVMRCPCGCGEDVIANLDPDAGPAWVLYRQRRGASLWPSVWRDNGCKSHFVVWDDRILLFSGMERWSGSDDYDREIDRRVLDVVPDSGPPIEYRDIARRLEEVPWSVLASCRRLSATGELREVGMDMFAKGGASAR